MERRVRYPGKHRMAESDDVTAQTGSAITYATLDVGRGQWLVNGLVNIVYPTTNASEVAVVTIEAFDRESGEDLGPIGPPQSWAWKGAASATDIIQPFAPAGHVSAAGPVRLELIIATISGGANHSVTMSGVWLHAAPL